MKSGLQKLINQIEPDKIQKYKFNDGVYTSKDFQMQQIQKIKITQSQVRSTMSSYNRKTTIQPLINKQSPIVAEKSYFDKLNKSKAHQYFSDLQKCSSTVNSRIFGNIMQSLSIAQADLIIEADNSDDVSVFETDNTKTISLDQFKL
ncbi:Hypothetical_protein [Hexamita inflata]|uniref:Hypothetical_protein n=1 Tax=Hexamita inflata TaxID=28002 RepID=A0AA86QLK4_9EUKA|nr:Hypothetical protein HINF_LOCUS46407 [Hexamita inflata]